MRGYPFHPISFDPSVSLITPIAYSNAMRWGRLAPSCQASGSPCCSPSVRDIAPKVLELLVRKGQRAEVDVRERTGEVVREADEFVVPM